MPKGMRITPSDRPSFGVLSSKPNLRRPVFESPWDWTTMQLTFSSGRTQETVQSP